MGDVPQSEADLCQAVIDAPDDPSVWLTRSHAFRLLGRPAEARADLDRALKLEGGTVPTWTDEYHWLLDHGEDDQAKRVFERSRSAPPRTPLDWSDRALGLVRAGKYAAAAHDLAQAAKTATDPAESNLMDAAVIECMKKPVLERRWKDALALLRAYEPSSRGGPTTGLEGVLERIEANLLILNGDRAGFARHARTIVGRTRDKEASMLPSDLAYACGLAPLDTVAPDLILSLAGETITRRPTEEVWWHLPKILGLVRAQQYESAARVIDEIEQIHPGWDSPTYDILRAIVQHHLGHEAEARRWLVIATRKMAAQSPSGSAWSVLAGQFVQDALSYETLHQEAVELILDPAFPADPFQPVR